MIDSSITNASSASNKIDASSSVSFLDEAALIEARRKKREAIKAKYKGQETPMLVKALALNNDLTPLPSNPTLPTDLQQDSG